MILLTIEDCRSLRRQLGITQKEAANNLGVSIASLSKYERFDTAPRYIFERYCEFLRHAQQVRMREYIKNQVKPDSK